MIADAEDASPAPRFTAVEREALEFAAGWLEETYAAGAWESGVDETARVIRAMLAASAGEVQDA